MRMRLCLAEVVLEIRLLGLQNMRQLLVWVQIGIDTWPRRTLNWSMRQVQLPRALLR